VLRTQTGDVGESSQSFYEYAAYPAREGVLPQEKRKEGRQGTQGLSVRNEKYQRKKCRIAVYEVRNSNERSEE